MVSGENMEKLYFGVKFSLKNENVEYYVFFKHRKFFLLELKLLC